MTRPRRQSLRPFDVDGSTRDPRSVRTRSRRVFTVLSHVSHHTYLARRGSPCQSCTASPCAGRASCTPCRSSSISAPIRSRNGHHPRSVSARIFARALKRAIFERVARRVAVDADETTRQTTTRYFVLAIVHLRSPFLTHWRAAERRTSVPSRATSTSTSTSTSLEKRSGSQP